MELISSHFLNPSCACAWRLPVLQGLGPFRAEKDAVKPCSPQPSQEQKSNHPMWCQQLCKAPLEPGPEKRTHELKAGAWK